MHAAISRRLSILFGFLLLVVSGGLQRADAKAPPTSTVPAAEATFHVGEPEIVVEMVVRQAKDRIARRGIIFLDSEDDFHDPKNLGVAISAAAAAKYKEQGVANPAAHLLKKTVQVRGCPMRFEDRLYMPVHDPAQIVIIETEDDAADDSPESTAPAASATR